MMSYEDGMSQENKVTSPFATSPKKPASNNFP